MKVKEREYFQRRFRCRRRPRILRSLMTERKENPSIFFRKWRLGKRDATTYERKVRSGNWAFFLHLLHTKPQQAELS